MVVSPDVGGVARARAFAKKLNDAPLAIVDKRRSAHNVSEVMNLIGDVDGKVAVLVDDMIDTAGDPCCWSACWVWDACRACLALQLQPALGGREKVLIGRVKLRTWEAVWRPSSLVHR